MTSASAIERPHSRQVSPTGVVHVDREQVTRVVEGDAPAAPGEPAGERGVVGHVPGGVRVAAGGQQPLARRTAVHWPLTSSRLVATGDALSGGP